MSSDDRDTVPSPQPTEQRFEEFLARYSADQSAGRRVALADYLRDFADIEGRVAEEWVLLRRKSDPEPNTRKDDLQRIGSYRLLGLLGKGGQGAVYRAQHLRVPKAVAIKVLLRGGAAAVEAVKRFEQEAAIGATLSHPAICTVLDAGIADQTPYIAMEYVDGETLGQRIVRLRAASRQPKPARGAGPAPARGAMATQVLASEWQVDLDEPPAPAAKKEGSDREEASSVNADEIQWTLRYFEQVARALHFAHEQGVVHRDLKPGNLMITRDGQPKIMDFGLAHMDESAGPSLTETGDTLGTPAYMSPEQLTGKRIQIDRRTDIWALGVTMYECLGLSLPFAAPSREALYQAITFKDPQPLQKLNRVVGKDLRVVVEKCLEKDRDRRYATALELADELARVLRKEPILARPVGPLVRTARWAERHPALAVVLGLLFLSISSFSALQWVTNRDLRVSQAAAKTNAERADANAQAAEANAREARENALAAQRNAEESARNAEAANRNAEKAERESAEKSAALNEYGRLADIRRLQNAREELGELWPIDPKIVEPLKAWQQRYASLFAILPSHRKALEALREKAVPYTEEDRKRDFATEISALSKAESERSQVVAAVERAKAALSEAEAKAKDAEQIAAQLAESAPASAEKAAADEAAEEAAAAVKAAAAAVEESETALKAGDEEIASLRAKIAGRGSYSFGEDLDLQFRHDNLASLVTELTAFVEAENTSAVRNAAVRLQRSEQIERLTVTGPLVAPGWAACIQRAYDNDRYVLSEEDYGILEKSLVLNGLYDPATRRLRLKAQMGLIPIGPDPTSGLEEFLHLPSHDYAWDGGAVRLPVRRELPPGDRRSAFDFSNGDGMTGPIGRDGIILVLVPGGSFLVGAQTTNPEGPNYDPDAISLEAPVQRATLRPWLFAKYELTQGQWERGATLFGDLALPPLPSQYRLGDFANRRDILPRAVGRDHPVEQIDHAMATRWLAQMGLELPTEVQWERAARGGTVGERWAGASTIEDLKRIANISGAETAQTASSWDRTPEHRDAYVVHAPVGRFEGNGYGLFDLTGNVFEWTRDGMTSPPAIARAGDGLRFHPVEADATAQRVFRGGCFLLVAPYARVSLRDDNARTFRDDYLGARPSRSIIL